MLERVGPGTLVIVPGDREDVILTLTTAHLMGLAAAPPIPARGSSARTGVAESRATRARPSAWC